MAEGRKRIVDLHTRFKKLEKLGFGLIPIDEIDTKELVTIDPLSYSFDQLLELLTNAKNTQGVTLYYGKAVASPDDFYEVDYDIFSQRYNELAEEEGLDEEERVVDQFLLDTIHELIDEYNSDLEAVINKGCYFGALFFRINKIWHKYAVDIYVNNGIFRSSDDFVETLDKYFFDGALFGDDCDCDDCCCKNRDCDEDDCADDRECGCGHHHRN